VYVVFGRELSGTVNTAEGQQNLAVGAEPQGTLGFNMVTGDVSGGGTGNIILCARLADPGPAAPRHQRRSSDLQPRPAAP
jgi:hypothetical protein